MDNNDPTTLAILANYFAKTNPASPLASLLDKAAGVIAGPAIDAYQGMQRVWGANGEEYVPVEDINRTGHNIAEFATTGGLARGAAVRKPSAPAPAPAPTPAPAPQTKTVYHYGRTPEGGQFDPARSNYDGTVFAASTRKDAGKSSNLSAHPESVMHELKVDPNAKIFDFENPEHIAAAMQWWDDQGFARAKNTRPQVEDHLKSGEYSFLEPGPNDGWTVNPYLKENFDGYHVAEYQGGPKNLALHNPGYLTHPDGASFFSNGVPLMWSQPEQSKLLDLFDTNLT